MDSDTFVVNGGKGGSPNPGIDLTPKSSHDRHSIMFSAFQPIPNIPTYPRHSNLSPALGKVLRCAVQKGD